MNIGILEKSKKTVYSQTSANQRPARSRYLTDSLPGIMK